MTTIDLGKQDPTAVEAAAKQFVENYYRTFEANLADLVNLYLEDSALIDDQGKFEGKEPIMAELISFPFHQHHINTIHCLPAGDDGGRTMVHVTGGIRLDGKQHDLAFLQVFNLIPTPRESFHIVVEIFKMKFPSQVGKIGHIVFTPFSERF